MPSARRSAACSATRARRRAWATAPMCACATCSWARATCASSSSSSTGSWAEAAVEEVAVHRREPCDVVDVVAQVGDEHERRAAESLGELHDRAAGTLAQALRVRECARHLAAELAFEQLGQL